MVKLVDFYSEITEDVEFGTCELCFGTSDLHQSWLVFENEYGGRMEIETGKWFWGDYGEIYEFKNVVDFGAFILEKKIESLTELKHKFDALYEEYSERVE